MADRRPPAFDVPDQGDDPVAWDPQARAFVPTRGDAEPKQWFVGADAVGKAPPPRKVAGRVVASSRTAVAPPAAPPRPPTKAKPLPRPSAPSAPAAPLPAPKPEPATKRRRFAGLRRPKLRTLVALFGLLPLLVLLAGWLYADHLFDQVQRVEVGEALDPIGGGGTNYLIVGSDSREVVASAGAEDPAIQPGGDAPAGQRSDTMLVLRIQPDGSQMMSIPRDLLVTDPSTGNQGRINATYRAGPANLIRTVQQNLSIPVHRYIEVDFVTFSSLVDALGGITLGPDVVPHPAHDDHSGLDIGAGPVELDGRMALAFVRSRHYTETIDGREVVDATADLGRVQRQQAFLRTVLKKAGGSRNPITLLRVASSVTDGLRIDDQMSLVDAVRFAWNMGRLSPESVELPTQPFRASSGAAMLRVDEEAAGAALDRFR